MKKIVYLVMVISLLFTVRAWADESPLNLSCESAILMEYETGKVMFEKNPDMPLPPASITKIMTLLLIMEDIEAGKYTYDDIVIASERAKSMGGSTIFLDAGEKMCVYDLIKGIVVASGNDASVAMAEFSEGSVEAFVDRMNKRAKELSMENTLFFNVNGLPHENHKSSARDVAIMSRELIKHKEIFNFTTIWTDSLRNGEFLLANTNRLIRFYEGANGLKTGSTDEAGCSISATAKRGDMQLIAVVMKAPTSNDRFSDAKALLDYGFNTYELYSEYDESIRGRVPVEKGEKEEVGVKLSERLSALLKKGDKRNAEIRYEIKESVASPVKKGDVLGCAVLEKDGEVLAKVDLVASCDVGKIGLLSLYGKMLKYLLRIA